MPCFALDGPLRTGSIAASTTEATADHVLRTSTFAIRACDNPQGTITMRQTPRKDDEDIMHLTRRGFHRDLGEHLS